MAELLTLKETYLESRYLIEDSKVFVATNVDAEFVLFLIVSTSYNRGSIS